MKNGDWSINRSPSMTPWGRRAYLLRIRTALLAALGDKCCQCGFSDRRALHIDHVFSDGAAERKAHSGGQLWYHMLKNVDSGRYQILCANCNMIKKIVAQETPRKYADDHVFITEEPHKRIFKEKNCKMCNETFVPTNGRHIYCKSHSVVKG